jgi:hypothetical protein
VHYSLLNSPIALFFFLWEDSFNILSGELRVLFRGLYIGKYPPPREGKMSNDVIWGKNIKRGREKGENVKEKGRKGKEKEKRGSKRVK